MEAGDGQEQAAGRTQEGAADLYKNMTEKRSIVCDSCGKELVIDSKYPHHYGLHLEAQDYGINTSGIQHLIAMCPPIDSPKDFCGKKCLAVWLTHWPG